MSAFLEAWRRAASETKRLRANICLPPPLVGSSSDAQRVISPSRISSPFHVTTHVRDDHLSTGSDLVCIALAVPLSGHYNAEETPLCWNYHFQCTVLFNHKTNIITEPK